MPRLALDQRGRTFRTPPREAVRLHRRGEDRRSAQAGVCNMDFIDDCFVMALGMTMACGRAQDLAFTACLRLLFTQAKVALDRSRHSLDIS